MKFATISSLLEMVEIPREAIDDLDNFLASPRANLKDSTKKFLRSMKTASRDMEVFRVLFVDSPEELAKTMKMDQVINGAHGYHTAERVSSWTTDIRVAQELADENFDLGNFSIIITTIAQAHDIVLDTTRLSRQHKLQLRGSEEHLVRVLEDQKEVILDAGSYYSTILEIIDNR